MPSAAGDHQSDNDNDDYTFSNELLYQGAEARIYLSKLYTSTSPRECIVKERFVKTYRHPSLDATLSLQRLRAEVRLLVQCRKLGLDVPPILQIDVKRRRLWLGRIGPDAVTLHAWFAQLLASEGDDANSAIVQQRLEKMVSAIGRVLSRLHANRVIHGDLTMANILVRKSTLDELQARVEPRLALIDFGLACSVSQTTPQRLPEEKAVDLYVFERALVSSLNHSQLASRVIDDSKSEELLLNSPGAIVKHVLSAYARHYPDQAVLDKDPCRSSLEAEAECVLTKLDEVRARGRKRLAFG